MIGPHGSPGKLISGQTGYPLAISPNVLSVVIHALNEAWAIICADPAMHLAPPTKGNPEEDRYTDALCEILSYWLGGYDNPINGFTSDVFGAVERGVNLSNYDLSVINKQPDMVIRLANSPLVQTRHYVGIFAEAKVVSMKTSLTRYTQDGMARFVRGDYAWAMQDGVMIAYRKRPLRALSTLDAPMKSDTTLLVTPENNEHLIQAGLPIPAGAKSSHYRQWHYKDGSVPGTIRLWHLWAFDIP